MKFKLVFIFSIVLTLFSCTTKEDRENEITSNPNEANLEDFYWLEGAWIDSVTFGFKTPKHIIIEEWKIYADSMSGKGYSIIGADTTISELLSIVKTEKQIVYVARPRKQPVIGFPFKGVDKNQYLFENKAHDFPQKIGYQTAGSDSLYIFMEGLSNGVDRKMKYSFVRLK